jgi:hypothetical protein
MPLKSRLLSGDPKLEAAATSNPAHIKRGAVGPHVRKIQIALRGIDDLDIASGERSMQAFGASTENAVLSFKKKRDIINRAYENAVDPIVGVMTMAALDREMLKVEASADEASIWCSLASVLGYTANSPVFLTDDRPLRETVNQLQEQSGTKRS